MSRDADVERSDHSNGGFVDVVGWPWSEVSYRISNILDMRDDTKALNSSKDEYVASSESKVRRKLLVLNL